MSAPCPVFGFTVRVRLAPELSETASAALLDDFVRAVESRGLSAGGGAGPAGWTLTISSVGGQAVDGDREALAAWGEGRPEVIEISVGALVDLDDVGG